MKHLNARFVLFILVAGLFILSSCSKSDDNPVAPIASFSYTSARNFPVTVSFVNTSAQMGSPGFSYTWDLGDGTQAATTQNPSHIYSIPGFYTVSLAENTSTGVSTVSDMLDLTLHAASGTSGRPTIPNFIYSVDQQFTVTFTDQSQHGDNKHWTFGDGTEATNPGNSFTHLFSGTGPFIVQLTTTASGGSDQASATLTF